MIGDCRDGMIARFQQPKDRGAQRIGAAVCEDDLIGCGGVDQTGNRLPGLFDDLVRQLVAALSR